MWAERPTAGHMTNTLCDHVTIPVHTGTYCTHKNYAPDTDMTDRHHPFSTHSPPPHTGLPHSATTYTPVSVSMTMTHIPDHWSGVPKLAPRGQ